MVCSSWYYITNKKKYKGVIKIFLYELNNLETQLWNLLTSDEDLDKEIFDNIKVNEEKIILSYAKVWRQLISDIDQLKNEIERLQKRRFRFEAAASKLKENLLMGMRITDIKKVSTPDITLAIRKNPPSTPDITLAIRKNPPALKIDTTAEIPQEYFKNNPVLDKSRLKEDIKNGLIIDGVYLESSERVDIS